MPFTPAVGFSILLQNLCLMGAARVPLMPNSKQNNTREDRGVFHFRVMSGIMINYLGKKETSYTSHWTPKTMSDTMCKTYGQCSDGCWFITLWRFIWMQEGWRWGCVEVMKYLPGRIFMHVFSFIPDRLLLSRKCYELIHYAGGSCLPSSSSVLFLIHSPYGADAQLQPAANLRTVVCGSLADKWPGVEVRGDSYQAIWHGSEAG